MPFIEINSALGQCVFSNYDLNRKEVEKGGKFSSIAWIPKDLFNTGQYTVRVAFIDYKASVNHFDEKDVISFNVVEDISERKSDFNDVLPGLINPSITWEIIDKKT